MTPRKFTAGFSLIELLMAIAISGILLALAVPEFNTLIRRNSVEATSNTLQTTFAYARSEAIKRATNVSVIQRGSWQGGWQVILDNGTRLPDCLVNIAQSERILRQVDPPRAGTNVFESNATAACVAAIAPTGCFTFDREGQNIDQTGATLARGFCVQDSKDASIQRVVGFSQVGQFFLEKSK